MKMKLLAAMIILSFVMAAVVYPSAPDQIPTHWNAAGELDDYSSKTVGLFLFPAMMLLVGALFYVIPKIDPLKANIKKFMSEYENFILLIAGFFLYLQGLTIFATFNYSFDMTRMMLPALAALLYYIGILMEKAKQNWFIGIRTPWTLSDKVVWEKTHKLGGKLYRSYAMLFILIAGLPKEFFLPLIGLLILSSFYLILYSYLEYKKRHPKK